MQSQLLTQFYRAYTAWIDDGAPEGIIFSRQHGLCHNLQVWVRSIISMAGQEWYELDQEMRLQFQKTELHPIFPFNTGDRMYYQIEQNTMETSLQCHSNANRLSWARKHADIEIDKLVA